MYAPPAPAASIAHEQAHDRRSTQEKAALGALLHFLLQLGARQSHLRAENRLKITNYPGDEFVHRKPLRGSAIKASS
jgi:hypothetical protein